jgi:hypothetical protein
MCSVHKYDTENYGFTTSSSTVSITTNSNSTNTQKLLKNSRYTLRKTLADNQESAKWEDDCRWTGRFLLVKRKISSD